MHKKTFKIPMLEILFSILFILGFFIGTTALPDRKDFIINLSANAIMDVDVVDDEKTNKYLKTIALVLPVIGDNYPEKSPEPENNYNTSVPILASDGDEKIRIRNDTAYEINIEEVLSQPYEQKKNAKVLIFHTHTSEAYTKTEKTDYVETDPYRTRENDKNIISVGREIAKVLEENGIEVIHDQTYHDYPSYSGSYKRALETIKKHTDNNDIGLVLDIHRDAIADESGEYMKTMAKINGEEMAQALLVIGTDGGGLENPVWRDNLKTGLHLQKIMKEKYPELARDVHLCNERYNGHAGSIIIEIGSNGNTLPEAQKSAHLVGECIVALLK